MFMDAIEYDAFLDELTAALEADPTISL